VKLTKVIDELVEERDLDRTVLASIVSDGMLAAYKKRYPALDFRIDYDAKSEDIVVLVNKHVVSSVEDDAREISLRKAKVVDPNIGTGAALWLPFEGAIGRIEILTAKQVIAEKIRAVEARAIFEEFKPLEGTIIHGTIYKAERGGVIVKIHEALAFLPKSFSIPGDKYVIGAPVRALLREVLAEPRNENQLILDRSSAKFLTGLLQLEIPEVFDGVVEIKRAVRSPGYKSKVIVASSDANIDPVGTCVGVGGARIMPIRRELGGEKIDVIAWSSSLEDLIKSALKPAQIERVEVVGDNTARVWLDDDQRSIAIGKMGQNISLATELVGTQIQLAQKGGANKLEMMEHAFGHDENEVE
jgi:transcription termination/antitermination protein NusA